MSHRILNRSLRTSAALVLLILSACKDSPPPTPPAPAATPKPVAAIEADATPPGPDGKVPESQQTNQEIITITNVTGEYSKEELANIIQHLDWFAENFSSKFERPPKSIEELKAWRDPNYPLGLAGWPKPPAGKKWVMNPTSGQFSLADGK